MDLTFRDLQRQHRIWARKNFPETKPHQPLLGVIEELGELTEADPGIDLGTVLQVVGKLAHHHLKREQGIRGLGVEHRAKAQDAIGDVIIFLIHYCTMNEYDLQEIIEKTWQEVKKRDWVKDKEKGG